MLYCGSAEIGNRKSKFLASGPDFQPGLVMSCFWNGPCSVFPMQAVDTTNKEQVRSCRKHFDKQYELTKGASHRE